MEKEKQTDTKTYEKVIDSCYYIGELNEKGEPHGRGTMFFPADDGRKKYIGDFKNNKIEGQGIMIYANDDVYGGQFTDGKLNGRGTLSFSNGKIYSGNFENGLPEKEGMYFTTNGSSYEGNFVKGKEQGNGGKMYFGKNFQKYVGGFKDCLFNGQGTLSYPDGSYLEGYWEDSRLKTGKCKYANGTTIEIKDFKLEHFKRENAVRHKNAYMIHANATGEQKFYKIGTYGFYKEIFYSDNDFVNSAIQNVEEDGCLKDLEEKIQQNQVKQITLCLDVHGTEQNELCINEKELKLLLSKLKDILTKYPDVKLYIQNLSCFASTILEYNFGNIMEYLKTHVRISNLDDVIKYYFRDIGEKRVFYTKSIKENNKTMIDKIFEHHVASNELTNEDIKFEYWVLDKGELKRYDLGSHEKNKMQKNIDLFGLAETRQIVDDKKRALNNLICNLKEEEKKETDYSYDLQLQLEDKFTELLEAEKEILIPAEQEKYQGLNNINIDVKINKDIIDNKKSECKNI